MNHIFQISSFFRVPDGTLVSPFLNSKDSESKLPFGLVDQFSIAAGVIEPESQSRIHIMPFVTQVTFVRSGRLTIKMKGEGQKEPYCVRLGADEAVLTEPRCYFQLVNDTRQPCNVLYIVSPAYLFEMSDGKVLYDDSVVLDESWEEIDRSSYKPSKILPAIKERNEAEQRIKNRKP
jgi:hypothetical protein